MTVRRSRIRRNFFTGREAAIYAIAQTHTSSAYADDLRRLANELARGEHENPSLAVRLCAVEIQDEADRALYASRRCSRLRLRGGR